MSNENQERPDTPSSDQRGTTRQVCENCGTSIDTNDWYPITKERDSDGSLQLYPFCSEECQAAWLEDRRDR